MKSARTFFEEQHQKRPGDDFERFYRHVLEHLSEGQNITSEQETYLAQELEKHPRPEQLTQDFAHKLAARINELVVKSHIV